MRWTNTNYKNKIISFCRMGLAIMALWLIAGSGWLSQAQSGRKEKQSPAGVGSSTNSGTAKDNQQENKLPTTFIVATAASDYCGDNSQQVGGEYLARGGCIVELKTIPGVKVIEDENLERWEAPQTAQREDKAYLIWMELSWNRTSSIHLQPFRLRYLLFEPRTGKLVASGYRNGIRKTWGTNPRPTTLEEQVREAGRNIAYQVLSELKSNQ